MYRLARWDGTLRDQIDLHLHSNSKLWCVFFVVVIICDDNNNDVVVTISPPRRRTIVGINYY